ncbi:programmed cell death protein 7 [Erythrolamprus reginae]|uniref:programmed cell death protein 7 n=1 Tax=Erythrolamprus reginae TaxID=121349 RepID=UPI00396C8970
MAQPPPPHHFASRFGGPPQPAGFPPPALPPPGPFRGPPPQPFPRGLYPPFPGGGGLQRFLPPPPPHPPPPPPPQWPSTLPERPPLPWRPEGPPRPSPEASDAPGDEACDRDEAWLGRFIRRRRPVTASAASSRQERGLTADEAARAAGEALRAVARVAELCRAWRQRQDDEEVTPGETAEAEAGMEELRAIVRPLREPGALELLQARLRRARQKRLRRRKRRQEARAAREEEEARLAEREARIDRWRARRAQEVEDRRLEKELKAAADSVLSEVRKKQADTKRMAEILRGLEKLRKLRKEAAGRKGVCPPPAADEDFEREVQDLKASIKKRTELYEAEERALRVMLEGEQEEERKREMEKKLKKEREKLLQQKRDMDSKLFGDPEEFPFTHVLEPFTQYYLQAEYSLPALLQIRHEWDQYLVPAGHPEGDFIPPGWILPSPPSNDTWSTAVR